ncbi:hypothetical protein SCP_0502330 [Sparassis crispa]|uniref:Extracellular metalloproteinase n=1 Tax=Sparassis crispa TaxID=139825 RepID=A0A401GLX1_9APHY|nr:hypothetical protein SCP_0502330 [Sparassis crispa]GBE83186.1 hypothetical protein SCP_0502330 [Sparassis crispa]
MLPQLSSRLASCIDHDPIVTLQLQHDARYYLGKLYFDAVAYGTEELGVKRTGTRITCTRQQTDAVRDGPPVLPTLEQHGEVEEHFIDTLFPPALLENGTVPEGDFYRPTEFTAMDDRKPLVPKHGNSLIMQLILNGMKIQACRPSFLDARDAILNVDKIKCSNKCPVK